MNKTPRSSRFLPLDRHEARRGYEHVWIFPLPQHYHKSFTKKKQLSNGIRRHYHIWALIQESVTAFAVIANSDGDLRMLLLQQDASHRTPKIGEV